MIKCFQDPKKKQKDLVAWEENLKRRERVMSFSYLPLFLLKSCFPRSTFQLMELHYFESKNCFALQLQEIKQREEALTRGIEFGLFFFYF